MLESCGQAQDELEIDLCSENKKGLVLKNVGILTLSVYVS